MLSYRSGLLTADWNWVGIVTDPVINNYTDTVLEKLTTNTRVALRCSVRAATGLTFGHATRSHLTKKIGFKAPSF